MVPSNTGIFLCDLKPNLASALEKKNLALPSVFSEIIKFQFGKNFLTLLCILLFFGIIVASLSLKNTWLPSIFFLDFNSPYFDLISPHSHKPHKNTSLLVGAVLKMRFSLFCGDIDFSVTSINHVI